MYRALLTSVLFSLLTVQSQGQQSTNPEFKNCDLDGCNYSVLREQREVGRNSLGRLVELELLDGHAGFDDTIGTVKTVIDWDKWPRKVWIFCSTLYPTVMSQQPNGLQVTVLDFGVYGVGYSYLPLARLFHYTCNAIPSQEPTSTLSRKLGYSERPNDSDRIESMIKSPTDALDFINKMAPR